ncbi:DUF948 domain-containing protein [Gloeocapsopsis crepidinum LEGE 06123]|uniref:DUF948 domain-containing protein n=1 Tax=Gloeocapsopsis crepidinum LEGE 06123 TaxID=588587 RepID=A0ABR9UXL4_9CHRO|nr:DUF948 domain-containing protein [Gloeocapsopsis crepidinum LEGE 06123]
MIDPLFWLGLSILLVAVSLTAVLVAALPALQELARAARSAEKLFDTLRRDLPPTLEAIRLTGLEISDLTDDVSQGVQRASNVAKQVDQSIDNAVKQAQKVEVGTRSVFTGVKVAWRTFTRGTRRSSDRFLAEQRSRQRDRTNNVPYPEELPEENNAAFLEQYRSYTTNIESSQVRYDTSNWHDDNDDVETEER